MIAVRLSKTFGLLKKDDWTADASIDLVFDLTNSTSNASPEIEAVYLETGRGWTFKQDGQECASRHLDGNNKRLSHFIRAPVRRLQANSWAEIVGEKVLEFATRGSKFKDPYRVAGRAKVKLMTSDGAFEFPINIDVEVDEFPF